jgi:hypothetical protein
MRANNSLARIVWQLRQQVRPVPHNDPAQLVVYRLDRVEALDVLAKPLKLVGVSTRPRKVSVAMPGA